MRKIKFRAWHKGREEFREGVIATLLLDQQSGHKPTNEHFADRITLLFDHYCDVEDITNEVIKKIEGLAVSNKGEISLHKKLGEHLTEVGAYNTALSDVIELLKQPEKQEKTGELVGVCNCQCHCDLERCFTRHCAECEHCKKQEIEIAEENIDFKIEESGASFEAEDIKSFYDDGWKLVTHCFDNSQRKHIYTFILVNKLLEK